MAESIRLALIWHLHQPSYRDGLSGRVLLPWTRLHATKDYRDMVEILRGTPGVRVTFNLTPVLLDQLEAIAAGETDAYLDLARKPAASLNPGEQTLLLRLFFHAHPERMIDPYARYRELRDRARASRSGLRAAPPAPFTEQDLRDLQTWFYLAWVDPMYRTEEPMRSLLAKGRSFTEEEKQALLDWGTECAGAVIPAYRDALARGQVELITSAYHHPILPLLIDSDAPRAVTAAARLPSPAFVHPEDAAEQVRKGIEAHTRRFGAAPAGTWPPEGAVNDAVLALLADQGFRWAASDETVLEKSLKGPGPAGPDWPSILYRPYEVTTPSGPIAMVFRDRALSDLIGFTYMYWEAERAARDFVERVLRAGRRAADGVSRPLITVILDGENCWEAYPDDGRPFLLALYERLATEPGIETVTISEALLQTPPLERLARVPLGSWIREDLGIWIGELEKNRAWEELARARAALGEAQAAPTLEAQALAAATEEVQAAEASDWFWWYGETHASAHKDEMDLLFRSHLLRAYSLLGRTPPAAVRRSLREAARRAPDREAGPYLQPVLDGRETDFYEWRGVPVYDAEAEAGATHAVTSVLSKVRFGVDEKNLYVRVDWRGATPPEGVELRVLFPDPPQRALAFRLVRGSSGEPVWEGGGAGEGGAFFIDQIVELRAPFSRLGAAPGSVVRFRIEIVRAGAGLERAPRSGVFTAAAPSQDFWLEYWSGT
jgi:alpha-amylase/alpha-mannosidase (GH57 family)